MVKFHRGYPIIMECFSGGNVYLHRGVLVLYFCIDKMVKLIKTADKLIKTNMTFYDVKKTNSASCVHWWY